MVVTHNVGAKGHFDPLDAVEPFTVMACFGNFVGGQLNLEQIGIYSEYKAGDVLLLLSATVKHRIEQCRGELPFGATLEARALITSPILLTGIRHGIMLIWRESLYTLDGDGTDWAAIKKGKTPSFGRTSRFEAAAREGDAVHARQEKRRERKEAAGEAVAEKAKRMRRF